MKYISKNIISLVLFFSTISFAQDTIPVNTGWNMIGAVTTRPISEFRSEPEGIIISYYFGYSPQGYSPLDTLTKAKGYWVRASEAGVLFGGATSGIVCGSTAVQYYGKTYNTVQIGSQCWFKENLDVGTMIQGSITQTDNGTIEKYCYNNDTVNCNIYGGLYQWDEAMGYNTQQGFQGICPHGWHIPTQVEFDTLRVNVNNDANSLKAVGQGTGAGSGTNTSGFSALFAGNQDGGSFNHLGLETYFITSTQQNATWASVLYLASNDPNIGGTSTGQEYGFGLRCIKN